MEEDTIINGVLSFFIPGLGQAIEGYKTRGIILFIIALNHLTLKRAGIPEFFFT